MADTKGSTSTHTDIYAMHKEWDEALCPICMDHPHNAVLLVCSSHNKGCRSYICDTSYRHSNCLDRYKRSSSDCRNTSQVTSVSDNPDRPRLEQRHSHDHTEIVEDSSTRTNLEEVHEHNLDERNNQILSGLVEALGETNSQDLHSHSEIQHDNNVELSERSGLDINTFTSLGTNSKMKCPLCRGTVKGWMIVDEARKYLDLKHRSCSGDSCSFVGNYKDLRRHARRVHPTARPSDISSSRQLAWLRLENQREYNDILSAIRAATPSAVVLGDYVIDNGNGFVNEGRDRTRFPDTFFLFQMMNASRTRRPSATRRIRSTGRRFFWGRNLLDLQEDDEEDWNVSSDVGEDVSPVPRRRRRFS